MRRLMLCEGRGYGGGVLSGRDPDMTQAQEKRPDTRRVGMMKAVATLMSALAVAMLLADRAAAQSPLGQAIQVSQEAAEETAQHQARIDELDEETQRLVGEYRGYLRQLEQLQRYNESQRRQLNAQEAEMDSLRQDIGNITKLQRAVQPLMEDMLHGLQRIVAADLPFLPGERKERIERLTRMMDDPGRSPAQRFRLLVEAYQIENEYGRTIEAYRGDVTANGEHFENVEFLRIGRLTLVFRSDDGGVLKRFDPQVAEWVKLDDGFRPHVRTALRMARQQIPPDLLMVPLPPTQQADVGGAR